MEYATRAGAMTSRFYGETEELLPKYAWYRKNSKEKDWPGGSLKPNDLGLFDVYGYTWCQEEYSFPSIFMREGEIVEDREYRLVIVDTLERVMRGGDFRSPASSIRSAYRGPLPPTLPIGGVRPSRTFAP